MRRSPTFLALAAVRGDRDRRLRQRQRQQQRQRWHAPDDDRRRRRPVPTADRRSSRPRQRGDVDGCRRTGGNARRHGDADAHRGNVRAARRSRSPSPALAGSDLDTGWTGIAHNSVAIEGASVTTNLDCPGGGPDCTVDGSALVGTTFGSPLPLSSGGVATCVTNAFREGVTGTYNCETRMRREQGAPHLGGVPVAGHLASVPAVRGRPDRPTTAIRAAPATSRRRPGGALRRGRYQRGLRADVERLPAARHRDREPADRSVDPLTTGTVTRTADVDCASFGFPPGSCFCPDQIRPNPCLSGTCPDAGECQATAGWKASAPASCSAPASRRTATGIARARSPARAPAMAACGRASGRRSRAPVRCGGLGQPGERHLGRYLLHPAHERSGRRHDGGSARVRAP